MAWTEFSSYLTPATEGFLRGAQRAELLAAFDERLQAAGGAGVETADMAAYDQLRTIRVRYRAPGAPGVVVSSDMHLAILSLAPFFAATESATDLWHWADLLADALSFEGLSDGEWATVVAATAAGVESWRYWNVCRRLIRRLDICFFDRAALGTLYQRYGPQEYSVADAASAYLAASETSGVIGTPGSSVNVTWTASGPRWSVGFPLGQCSRTEFDYSIPSLPAFASYDVWSFASGSSQFSTDATAKGSWAGGAWSFAVPPGAADYGRQVLATGASATGLVTLIVTLGEYAERSALESRLTEVIGNPFGLSCFYNLTSGGRIFARPAWLYPAGS